MQDVFIESNFNIKIKHENLTMDLMEPFSFPQVGFIN